LGGDCCFSRAGLSFEQKEPASPQTARKDVIKADNPGRSLSQCFFSRHVSLPACLTAETGTAQSDDDRSKNALLLVDCSKDLRAII
jgi:hypothetical protein